MLGLWCSAALVAAPLLYTCMLNTIINYMQNIESTKTSGTIYRICLGKTIYSIFTIEIKSMSCYIRISITAFKCKKRISLIPNIPFWYIFTVFSKPRSISFYIILVMCRSIHQFLVGSTPRYIGPPIVNKTEFPPVSLPCHCCKRTYIWTYIHTLDKHKYINLRCTRVCVLCVSIMQ